MLDGQRVEGLHGGHARAGGVSEQHPVLDVAAVHPPRFEHPQQVGRQVVHLFKELLRVRVVAEVVVAGRVFVVVSEGYGRDDLIHRIVRHGFHVRKLRHAVVVDGPVIDAGDLHALHSNLPFHVVEAAAVLKPVAPDDLCHVGDHLIVLFPLMEQHLLDLRLRFCVDDVDDHLLRLEKPVDPVDCLYEIVELVVDAQEYGAVAMALKVTALAGDGLLGGQQPRPPVGKVDDPLFPDVDVQRAVDLHGLRQGPLDGVSLRLQIVPQYEVGLRVAPDDLQHLRHPVVDGIPLFLRGVLEGKGGVPDHLHLAALIGARGGVVHRQTVPAHVHLRQVVAGVVIAQVAGL